MITMGITKVTIWSIGAINLLIKPPTLQVSFREQINQLAGVQSRSERLEIMQGQGLRKS